MLINNFIKNINKPIHIDIEALTWISQQTGQIFLSPKADGIYAELKCKGVVYQCEYIDKLDLYLIFDIKSFPIKHLNNILNRNKWIRNMHPFAKKITDNIVNDESQIQDIFMKDYELLKQYLSTTIDKIKWYPKIIFNINLNASILYGILDKNYDSILNYKTDGWVLTSLKKLGKYSCKNYKYKPINELTIDILYSKKKWLSKTQILQNVNNINKFDITDNTIWRCEWIDGFWSPRELRSDKKCPNNQNIIEFLETTKENF